VHKDFYMLAGTVLPILLLALLIETRAPVPVLNLDSPMKVGRLTVKLNTRSFFKGAFFSVPVTAGLVGWAEYVCLRGLETGRQTAGGTSVVWAMLAYVGGMLILRETARTIAEIYLQTRK
jgi:hypothetical protein